MKFTKTMPKTGQFIAVWEYNGVLWSETIKYKNLGSLYYYNTYEDKWRKYVYPGVHACIITYIIKEEDRQLEIRYCNDTEDVVIEKFSRKEDLLARASELMDEERAFDVII